MADRSRALVLPVAAAAALLAAAPLLLRPVAAFALVVAMLVVVLAARSPAWPVALSAMPPVAFELLGYNPFPPGSLPALIAASLLLGIFFAVVLHGEVPPTSALLAVPVIASLLILALMMLRLGPTGTPAAGEQKVELFIVGNLVFLAAGMFVGLRREHVRLVLLATLGTAIAGALVMTVNLLSGTVETVFEDRFTFATEEDPFALGRAAGAGLIVAVGLVLASAGVHTRIVAVAAIPLLAVALLAGGSRGPVTSLVAGLATLLVLAIAGGGRTRRILLLVAGGGVALLLVPQVLPDATVSRALSLGASDLGNANGRDQLWGEAYTAFAQHPFDGIGTAAYSARQGFATFPHNVFLEAGAELGIFGFAALLALAVSVPVMLIVRWRRSAADDRVLSATVLGLFVASLTNAMFSGAIPHNRSVWLWAGVATGMSAARARA